MNSDIDIKHEAKNESLDMTNFEEEIDIKDEAEEESLDLTDLEEEEEELESRHEEEEGFHAIYFNEEVTFEANRDDWATNIEADSLEDPLQLDEDKDPGNLLGSSFSGVGLSGLENRVEENQYIDRYPEEEAEPEPTSPISSEIDSEEEVEPIPTIPSRVRNKDFCFFCRTMVSSFARHVERNHAMEDEVQQILICPRKSTRRTMLLAILRKKGNFLASQVGIIRPVRKNINDDKTAGFLPCTFCLGLYSSSLLWKHRKRCPLNPSSIDKARTGQAAGLAMMSQFEADRILRETIFPSMRPDSITLAAQKDSLICEYGSRYLRTHVQQPQFIRCNVKMRQLTRVLISAQKMDSRIRNLIDALRPQNFKTLVAAAKEEAGYNKVTNSYYSKSFAMNIGPLLKDCCEVAIYHVMETKFCFRGKITSELVKEFKQTLLLVQSNWNIEFFHLKPCHKNKFSFLHDNRKNKIAMKPLDSDIGKFRDYLIANENEAADSLKNNSNDIFAFKTLSEVLYCRVALLGGKRAGLVELPSLTVQLYKTIKENKNCGEFEDIVKQSEMILLRKLKGVLIPEKRRYVPVLFRPDVEEKIETLIELRYKFVEKGNPYLFPSVITVRPIAALRVLSVHAKKANLKSPDAFSLLSLKLLKTKHLTTISRLFDIT